MAWQMGSVLLFLFLTVGSVYAGEIDLLGGFDDPTVVEAGMGLDVANVSCRHFSGYAKLGTTYNIAHDAPDVLETDWRGLSRLRTELQVEADYRLWRWKFFVSAKGWYDFVYSINGRSRYTSWVLDTYEEGAELREAFMQGEVTDNLDVKIGRQVVAWGRSDNFRVTDILNPLDNLEPGLTDIEDLRLPVTMSKIDYFSGDWRLALIAVHEHRYSKLPPFGSDFYFAPISLSSEDKSPTTLGNTGLALEVQGNFAGWDISLYGAHIYNDQLTLIPSWPMVGEHRRISMAGAAMSVACGDFLYILEAAHFRGLRFMTDYNRDYARTDLLTGIEYRGFTDTVISVDLLNRHLHNFRAILVDSPEFPQEDQPQAALRITRGFLNDQLDLTALLIIQGKRAQDGALQRFTAKYDLADNWSMTGGAIFYQSGTRAMIGVDDNDRLFLEIRLDF